MLSTVFTLRYALITWPAILVVVTALLMAIFPGQTWWLLPAAGLCLASVLIGLHDLRQTRHAVLRNYPVAAHLRFLLEAIRPEMRQYFFEGDKDGTPFPRDKRAIVYQRAKKELDKRPFGTQFDVYQEQYEWLHHSIAPKASVPHEGLRTTIGTATTQPYSASLLNISAMSYGSLSANAIRSLNRGAKAGFRPIIARMVAIWYGSLVRVTSARGGRMGASTRRSSPRRRRTRRSRWSS
jgi:hypothetical protein